MNRSLAVLAVLAALVLLALIVFAIGRLRGRRPADPGAPAPRTAPAPRRTGSGSPAPREIWWAEVPFEDGTGAKDRPCLVLRVHGGTATVAKITSKHHAERPGVLALPRAPSPTARAGPAGWSWTSCARWRSATSAAAWARSTASSGPGSSALARPGDGPAAGPLPSRSACWTWSPQL